MCLPCVLSKSDLKSVYMILSLISIMILGCSPNHSIIPWNWFYFLLIFLLEHFFQYVYNPIKRKWVKVVQLEITGNLINELSTELAYNMQSAYTQPWAMKLHLSCKHHFSAKQRGISSWFWCYVFFFLNLKNKNKFPVL